MKRTDVVFAEEFRLTHTTAALLPKPAQALITIAAASAVFEVAFAALGQHALGHDAGAQHLVAGVGELRHEKECERREKDNRQNSSFSHLFVVANEIPGRTKKKIQR